MVGRAREFEAITAALGSAGEEPLVISLLGQAGIGKTTLAGAAAEWAADHDHRIAWGAAVQLAESVPYAPLVMALRRLIEPELMAGLTGAEAMPKAALFHHLAEGLSALAAEQPLLIVVEDIHWADTASLDLLTVLATQRLASLALLVTAREDELIPGDRASGFVADVARLPTAHTVRLGPLDEEAVAELLRARGVGDRLDAEQVLDRSAGIPLLVEEVIGQSQAGGAAPGPPAAELLHRRIDGLQPSALRLAFAVAVRGRPTRLTVAASVAGIDGQESARAVARAAIEAGVLVDTGEGLDCRHALFRQALIERLLTDEQVEWHLRVAETLASRPDFDPAELAAHWEAAERPAEALAAALDAIARTASAAAPSELLAMYERALRCRRSIDEAGVATDELALATARAALRVGRNDRGAELARSVAEDDTVDRRQRIRAYTLVGICEFHRANDRAVRAANAAALTLLRPGDAADLHALAHAWHSLNLSWRHEMEKALHHAERAVEHAAADGSPAVLAPAYLAVGQVSWLSPPGVEAPTLAVDAVEVFTQVRALAMESQDWTVWAYAVIADLQCRVALANVAGDRTYEDAAMLAVEAFDRAHSAGEFLACFLIAGIGSGWVAETGDLPGAKRMLGLLPSMPVEGRLEGLTQETAGYLALLEGRFDDAEQHLRDADLATPRIPELEGNRMSLVDVRGRLLLARGRPLEALEELWREMPARARFDPVEVSPRTVVDGLLHARMVDAGGPAIAWAEEFVTHVSALPRSSATVIQAQAELTRLGTEPAPKAWQMALVARARIRARMEACYCRYRLAEALLEAGARHAAVDELRQSLDDARRMGLTLQVEELERLATRAGIAAAPDVDPVAGLGLTEREVEVLRLVAAGMTNRQIGGELFISPKTAGAHVSNILTKLGVARRGEAAAIAHRLELW